MRKSKPGKTVGDKTLNNQWQTRRKKIKATPAKHARSEAPVGGGNNKAGSQPSKQTTTVGLTSPQYVRPFALIDWAWRVVDIRYPFLPVSEAAE
jgi:hypothetical protein